MEDYPDVLRIIDLKANATLEDLHLAILQSVGFDTSQLASIYLCDEHWAKKAEYTLIEMNPEESELTPVMRDVKLEEIITKKGQQLLYEYDFVLMWRFLVEVEDIVETKSTKKYPQFVKSAGEAPLQYETKERYPDEVSEEDAVYIEALQKQNMNLLLNHDEEEEPWDETVEEGFDDLEDFGSEKEFGYDDE